MFEGSKSHQVRGKYMTNKNGQLDMSVTVNHLGDVLPNSGQRHQPSWEDEKPDESRKAPGGHNVPLDRLFRQQ